MWMDLNMNRTYDIDEIKKGIDYTFRKNSEN